MVFIPNSYSVTLVVYENLSNVKVGTNKSHLTGSVYFTNTYIAFLSRMGLDHETTATSAKTRVRRVNDICRDISTPLLFKIATVIRVSRPAC